MTAGYPGPRMAGASSKIGVFVLGMHRSGTSAITRIVNMLGIAIVEGNDRLEPDDHNPSGYWESKALTHMNRRLIAGLGGEDIVPGPTHEPAWEKDEGLAGLREEARILVERVQPRSPWVWKDPRTCLTLPFWVEAAGVDPIVVLIHRNPVEVADSLARRDNAAEVLGLALWEHYNRAALTNAAGLPTFVLAHDELIDQPRAVAGKLAAFLRDQGLDVEDPSSELEAFIDPGLHRSRRNTPTRGALSAEQIELEAVLKRLEGPHGALAPPRLSAETPWVEPLLDLERRIRVLGLSLEVLETQVARKTAFGLEVRVIRGSRTWRYLRRVRRLRNLITRRAVSNAREPQTTPLGQ